MSRLLALSLLALAAPGAAAEQVHSCHHDNPTCSLELELTLRGLDEASRELEEANRELEEARRDLAQARRDEEKAIRDLDELTRTTGPGTAIPWETPTERYNRMNKPRYHVPYPLSRELLTGAVNPCAGSRPACPWELKKIYDGLERNRDDEDSWHYRHYLNQLGDYYRNHQP